MTAGKQIYSLWDDLERFDLGDSGAIPSEWKGKKSFIFREDEFGRISTQRSEVQLFSAASGNGDSW